MKRALVLLVGMFSAAAVFAATGDDALQRLVTDDSPDAGRKLTRLYHSTTNPDQRFWLVQAMAQRLRDRSDPEALEALLLAAQEVNSGVRGSALRALTVFDSLPREELNKERIEKIETVARLGIASPVGPVREAAIELERTLKIFKDPQSRDTPPPPKEHEIRGGGFLTRASGALRWVWIILFPVLGAFWAWSGAPVFDHKSRQGQRAAAAFLALSNQTLFLGICGFVWVNLAAIIGGYGFYAMAEILGHALYSPPGTWAAFYLSSGFCLLFPASLAAAGLARNPAGSLFANSLRSLPWAVLFSLVALIVFVPLEILYRLFLRRPRGRDSAPDWLNVLLGVLDTGSFRSAHLAAAIAAREDRGLWPALVKVVEFLPAEARRRDFGLAGFDPRFVLLCGTPAMALLCTLVAKGMPVRWFVGWPIIMLGCGIWAWGVLATVLFALVQTLSAVDAAARVVRASGGGLPDGFDELCDAYDAEEENGE